MVRHKIVQRSNEFGVQLRWWSRYWTMTGRCRPSWIKFGARGYSDCSKRWGNNKQVFELNFPQEKQKFQSSFDNKFIESSKSGDSAVDLFLDRANPYNKVPCKDTV